MTEQQQMQVPMIKKSAKVPIEIEYQHAAAIVQSLFIISGKWTKDQQDEFKNILDTKTETKNPEYVTYLLLDQLYRKILKTAQENEQTEMTDVTIASPLEAN